VLSLLDAWKDPTRSNVVRYVLKPFGYRGSCSEPQVPCLFFLLFAHRRKIANADALLRIKCVSALAPSQNMLKSWCTRQPTLFRIVKGDLLIFLSVLISGGVWRSALCSRLGMEAACAADTRTLLLRQWIMKIVSGSGCAAHGMQVASSFSCRFLLSEHGSPIRLCSPCCYEPKLLANNLGGVKNGDFWDRHCD